jgi:hypothetical protein
MSAVHNSVTMPDRKQSALFDTPFQLGQDENWCDVTQESEV